MILFLIKVPLYAPPVLRLGAPDRDGMLVDCVIQVAGCIMNLVQKAKIFFVNLFVITVFTG